MLVVAVGVLVAAAVTSVKASAMGESAAIGAVAVVPVLVVGEGAVPSLVLGLVGAVDKVQSSARIASRARAVCTLSDAEPVRE